MYINLLIILFNVNLPLFALQLFDCENLGFRNPIYFILQINYINIVFKVSIFCWLQIASKK